MDRCIFPIRIRHCNGNIAAWCACVIRDDGSEANSFGAYKTAMTIDGLLSWILSTREWSSGPIELVL